MDKNNDTRIEEILDVIMKVARGDFSIQIELNGKNDELDSLAIGINMMIDDIKANNQELLDAQLASLNIMEDLNTSLSEQKKLDTELKKTLKELEAKNQELEDYTYTVSHDLKTPLVTIQVFAELLNNKYADQMDEKAKHYLQRITQGTDNLGTLVSNLLELSRAGRKSRPFELHDFNEILEVSLAGLEGKLTQNNVKITHSDDFPKVHSDDLRMEQVLSNLIGNSVKYMGDQPEPEVEIGWKEEAGHYRFWVKDNGIGIREEDQDRIFKVFERAETGFDEEGSGIGLSIVKKIIQVHGCDVWVESEFGKGSTFYFELPKKGVDE